MFVDLYVSVMTLMRSPRYVRDYEWLQSVYATTGQQTADSGWISGLAAFWPGLQALAGQTEDAKNLHSNFTSIWRTFGSLPEVFLADGSGRHEMLSGYYNRPEHIESTYFLYTKTKDPYYLEVEPLLQLESIKLSSRR